MFIMKHNHDLDQMMRRGIENIRAAMLEKSIAYNLFKLKISKGSREGRAPKLAAKNTTWTYLTLGLSRTKSVFCIRNL
jgi:hypothetical protein